MQLGERRASYAAQQHAPLGRRLGGDANGRPQRGRGLVGARVAAGVDDRQRAVRADLGADRRDAAEPDAVVDLVVLAPAVAAEAGDDEADGARVRRRPRSRGARARPAWSRSRAAGASRGSRAGRPGRRARRPSRAKRSAALPSSSVAWAAARAVSSSGCRRAWTSAAAASAIVTSCRRGSRAAPVRWSIDSRTSSALPAVVPSTSSMSVISATVFRPGALGHLDQRLGELLGVLAARHERARAGLDVEHERVEALGQLLGQDRGHDQRDRLDRAGGVADGVQAAVGGRQVGGLADDRAAGLAHDAADHLGGGDRLVAGDAVELVQRAAGVAEAAAGDHRHRRAAGGQDRGEDQRDLVADAAGRVLVQHRPVEVPLQDGARVAHRRW